MKDENDKVTGDLYGDPPAPLDFQFERQTSALLGRMQEKSEDAHLAEDHALVPVKAYIKDPEKAKKKTDNNRRVQKHNQRKKEAGLVKSFVPAEVHEALKQNKGDFSAWLEEQKRQAVDQFKAAQPAAPAKPAQAPATQPAQQLTKEQRRLIEVGQKVSALVGWKRRIVNYLLGV